MRAMIIAAGLGKRLAPLTNWRPKPALPVRGIPLIGFGLAFLAKNGVTEVIINTYHLSEALKQEALSWCPAQISLSFSPEKELLGTGGGIKQAANFLAESETSIVMSGDMVFDFDLSKLIRWHNDRDNTATLLLKRDPREHHFGTIGINQQGNIRRIAQRFDIGEENRAGIYTSVNIFSANAFDSMPKQTVFSHLDDWIIPRLASGDLKIGGYLTNSANCIWEPVGTLEEYFAANYNLPEVSYFDSDELTKSRGTRFRDNLIIGHRATIDPAAHLGRVVIWDKEHVPGNLPAHDGVFANGMLHRCLNVTDPES